MTTSQITDANQGLGLETARRLVALGHAVVALAPIGNRGLTGTLQDSSGLVRP